MSRTARQDHPCVGCGSCGSNRLEAPPDSALSGWRLGVAAAAVFVLPLVLAAVGAMALGPGRGGQLGGALVGLAVGLAGGIGIGKLVSRSAKEGA